MQLKNVMFLFLAPLLFAGCGGSTDSAGVVSKLAQSQKCMGSKCHAESVSPGTGKLIPQEWLASNHNLANAAGCADCHEPHPGHPSSCSKCHGGGSGVAVQTPDAAGKCGKCHGPAHPGDVMMKFAPQHYGYSSATVRGSAPRASYVSAQYEGNCRACHNPHLNTLTQNHREYAKSMHADPKGVAFTHYDFKQNSFAVCQRCHTSTGFKYFVANGTAPSTGFSTTSSTREVIACDACHASYDYANSIRKVPAFTASYKNFDGTAKASYPDSGESNLCIPCHTGRESAQAMNGITDFSNTGFGAYNSHYLAAAGLMYMQGGFIDFVPRDTVIGTTTYGKSLSPDSVSTPGGIVGGTTSTHRKFGTPLINGDFHNPAVFVAGVMDKNGPCITCHVNANGLPTRPGYGHSLHIDGEAFKQVCSNCHHSENTVTLTAENFRSVFLEPQKEAYENALKLLEFEIARYGVSFNESAYPYFYDEDLPLKNGAKQPVTDWTRKGTVDGRKFLGACYNFNLLKREPASYAHARSYSRRLIYDSIDYLDDLTVNLSVGTTAINSGLAVNGVPLFGKDTHAFNYENGARTTIYGNTTEAMLYLISWNFYTGDWNAIERP